MDYTIWINKAIMKVGELENGTIFVLKDLFSGVEWNTLSVGNKREFGRQFKSSVISGIIPNIVIAENQRAATTYKKNK